MIRKLVKKWTKNNGISVLISAQNEEKIIRMCVESFLEFGDEIIIVTNGSTDGTIGICKELEKKYPQIVRHYDKPALPDLYQNRAYALSKAKYKWVMRGDADYVAYNDEDGKRSIQSLRKRILKTNTIFPTAFFLEQVNIYYRINMTGISKKFREKQRDGKFTGHFVPETYAGYMSRIYLNTPLLKFIRQGRTEGVRFPKLYKQIFIDQPYWFHVTLKAKKDLFYRSERTNWRELGDYNTYPYLQDYIEKNTLVYKYSTSENEAIEQYMKDDVLPYLKEYDESKNYPYPQRILNEIESGYFS
ncbi:glycosyltransferase [Vibrio sp. 404]|uniref:Glycosyltransferase n=1 Tax=Vibrio marinisediminis TaxID=2758441 RepID=A0A7W2ITR0_9VIBR|nr:glycosyltransferase [Vibrio marinisediminis]MBA5762801.1 glycosyltransferase [Vibrio marinisediminis]